MPPHAAADRCAAVALLVAGATLGLARQLIARARARRTQAGAHRPITWDVPLREPLWSRTSGPLATCALAAALGAAGAWLGSAGVGAGMSATVVFIGMGVQWASDRWSPRQLTFAADGLHVGLRRCRFVIAWADVAGVDTLPNPDLAQVTVLSVARVAGSAAPGDAGARTQVASALYDGSGVTGRLLVPGFLAGVDGATLARALREAAHTRSAAQPN